VWFRKDQLVLLGPELDPYIAQVLLGMCISGGEIVLPGLQDIAEMDEHEIYSATRRQATARKRADQKGPLYNTSGRLDPVAMAYRLDPLFPATETIRPLSSIQLAFIWENLRVEGRRAGLTKEQADFLVRMAMDGAKQHDNPSAWRRDCGPFQLQPSKMTGCCV
jgi:hypothetical protein